METGIDTTALAEITQRVNSVEKTLAEVQVSTTYYQSILDHQWVLLSIQTAIFVAIIIIFLTAAGLISWHTILKKLIQRQNEIERKLLAVVEKTEKVEKIEQHLFMLNINVHRSLYEGTPTLWMKIVWHIRYCQAIYERGIDDDKSLEAFIIRIDTLEYEFDQLRVEPAQFQNFVNFENIGGVKAILKRLIQDERKEISRIPTAILNHILEKEGQI